MLIELALLLLAVLGFIISLHHWLNSKRRREIVCFVGKPCPKPLKRRYARIFFLPNIPLGLIFYLAVGWAALNSFSRLVEEYYALTLLLAIAVTVSSLYLLSLQHRAIKAWCNYCLVSSIINVLILCFLVFWVPT